jgi:hypothetical protein
MFARGRFVRREQLLAAEQTESRESHWNDGGKWPALRLAALEAMANLNGLEFRLDTEAHPAA